MAFTPCAVHKGMYKGGASTFFLRIVEGTNTRGGKLQVCANDATLLLDYLHEHANKASEGDTFYELPSQPTCLNCRADVGTTAAKLFGNAYPRGLVESQWFGYVCAKCVEAVAADLSLDRAVR